MGSVPKTAAPARELPPRETIVNPAEPSGTGASVVIPLSALADSWPEALRGEILQLKLTDAKLALPVEPIADALKRGRVAFPWKIVRSWIRPQVSAAVSTHDNTVLELPLKVITPVFLARQKEALKTQHKVAIDESIPNLFFGFPQPDA